MDCTGFLEGYLTAKLIELWLSTDIIYPDPKVVPGERKFVAENLAWLQDEISARNGTDPWFYQASLILQQLQVREPWFI